MSASAKRQAKKQRKSEQRAERREHEARVERVLRRRRLVNIALPVVTILGAVFAYVVLEDTRAVGVIALVGTLTWFLYGLGMLGASVKVRDRQRAGSIDFGRRS